MLRANSTAYRVDAHQHFWHYTPEGQPWIDESMAVLRRDYLPGHLAPELEERGVHGTVAVQAPQTLEETRFLLAIADQTPWVLGVVGWVDLCGDEVQDVLFELATHPRFVGVRHIVQDEPDGRFVLRPDFQRGIAALAAHGLTYDILVFADQLPAVIELVARFPEQPFVLDHMAKPRIAAGVLDPWARHIEELAQNPLVHCKVSGMVTEADAEGWKREHFRPYLDVVLDAFGPDRLMFGSDWPVCRLAAEYGEVHDLVTDYVAELPPKARDALMGGTASRFYGLQLD